MQKNTLPIIIVGAGLAGSLMAIYMARRGFQVEVFESRADMRKIDMSAGRSINLALSNRGLWALRNVGLEQRILEEAIPMPGRMLHANDGQLTFAPYGKDSSEYINSISRGELNKILMTEAEKYERVRFHFDVACTNVDFDAKTIHLEDGRQVQGQVIIGADGANSAVRRAMEAQIEGYQSNVDWLTHGYKELTMPPLPGGGFALEKNALHIWPRGSYMLIALPNNDGSFTCTLFFPNEGEISFESLDSKPAIRQFFLEQFVDAVPYLTNLEEEFLNNPVGKLGTLKCYPWRVGGSAVILGDAAHAVVPFYGQGMNASFEDCRILDECMADFDGNWETVLAKFEALRKVNGDAIGDLAVENYYEMRDHVADPTFRKKRTLEHHLENTYEDYHSKYSLVTFHPEVDYSVAKERGNKQDALLMDICKNVDDVDSLDAEVVYQQLKGL